MKKNNAMVWFDRPNDRSPSWHIDWKPSDTHWISERRASLIDFWHKTRRENRFDLRRVSAKCGNPLIVSTAPFVSISESRRGRENETDGVSKKRWTDGRTDVKGVVQPKSDSRKLSKG